MAKVTRTLKVTLTKNTSVEKGGAWLLTIDDGISPFHSAWTNPSAAKRHVKEYVIQNTPRKSIKMIAAVKHPETDKPINIVGELTWKVDA
jgi:hypothetical protein